MDYSALNAGVIASITYDSGTGYGGEFRAVRNPASATPTTASDLTFKGIEDIQFVSTNGGRANYTTVAVTVAPRGAGTTLNLDAGDTRNAYIQIDVKAIDGLSLAMGADGSIVGEAGSFRHFSSYRILYGEGENTYRGGDTNATAVFSDITSSADGGSFHKTSVEYFIDTTDDITLHVSGRTGTFSGGAGFTDAVLTDFHGGSGVNRLYTDSLGSISGLNGRNELYLDLSSYDKGVSLDLTRYSRAGSFSAAFRPVNPRPFDPAGQNVEIYGDFTLGNGLVNAILSPNNDRVYYNFVEGDVVIDGRGGTDTLPSAQLLEVVQILIL